MTIPDNPVSVVEKERKKADKAKKFAEKQAKTVNSSAAPATSKSKEKKAKQEAVKEEPLPEYVEETPPGVKKSMSVWLRQVQLRNDY